MTDSRVALRRGHKTKTSADREKIRAQFGGHEVEACLKTTCYSGDEQKRVRRPRKGQDTQDFEEKEHLASVDHKKHVSENALGVNTVGCVLIPLE